MNRAKRLIPYGYVVILAAFLTVFLYLFQQNYFAYQRHLLESGTRQETIKNMLAELKLQMLVRLNSPADFAAHEGEKVTDLWRQFKGQEIKGHVVDDLVKKIDDDVQAKMVGVTTISAVQQLQKILHTWFWHETFQREAYFFKNTQKTFFGLILAAVVIFVLSAFTVFRRVRPVDGILQHLVVDEATGFFIPEAFSLIARRELDRAKRRGFGLALVAVQIDPLEQIKNDLGISAVERLVSAMALKLRASVRSYDCGFHFRENIFVFLFSETDAVSAQMIKTRVSTGLQAKGFLVDNSQTEVIPRVRVGMSLFPQDALELNVLVQKALKDFSVGKSMVSEATAEEYVTLVGGDLSRAETDLLPLGFWQLQQPVNELSPLGKCAVEPEFEDEDEVTEKTRRLQGQEEVVRRDKLDFSAEEQEEHSVVAYKTLESELAALDQARVLAAATSAKGGDGEKSQEWALSDVVLALTQDTAKVDVPNSPQKETVFDRVRDSSECDEISEITGITDIKILQREGDEDVIMVDFEREKFDLATKFRQHQKRRRARGVRT